MPWRQHPDPTWQTQLNAHINAHTSTKKTCFVYICVYKYIYTHTHKQRRHLNFSQCIFKAARIHELTGMSRGDNLQTLLLQLWHVLSQHFSGKLSSFLFALSNIIPSLSKQLSSAVRLLPLCLCLSLCSRGADTQRGCWRAVRQNRQNEKERGGTGGGWREGASGSVTVSYGRGIPWEEWRFRRKERAKEWKKRASQQRYVEEKKRRRNGGECCFDVKGDGRAAVRRARGRERKIKRKGWWEKQEGKAKGRVDPRQ